MRARVLSLYFLALGVLYPVGITIQGPLADRLGLPTVTIGGALSLLAVAALIHLARPEILRALDTPEPSAGTFGSTNATPAGGRSG
jgi:predicted MFS family arabinose efflux permease